MLYEKTTWINPNIEYVFDEPITEYDMHSAGLSLIQEFKLLPDEIISDLLKIRDKAALNKKIGLIQRNNRDFAKKLLASFAKARQMFLTSNNIEEDNIISIKKDAIFIVGKYCMNTSFGSHIQFTKKNSYSSYIRLNKLEFYLNPRMNVIHVKGLGQGEDHVKLLEYHGEYIFKFFMTFTRMRENHINNRDMSRFLIDFVYRYRHRQVDIGYYRRLNRENAFMQYDDELQDFISVEYTNNIEKVDIGFNYMKYIVPLVSLYI